MRKTAILLAAAAITGITTASFAKTLPLEFPLNLKYGMYRKAVADLIRIEPKKTNASWNWPLSGQITYKHFRPEWAVILFKFDKTENDKWLKAEEKKIDAAKTKGGRLAIYEEERTSILEFEKDTVEAVFLNQEVADCNELRKTFEDAAEFVTDTYDVTLESKGEGFAAEPSRCLGGESHLQFAGRQGYSVELAALMNSENGSFVVNLGYWKKSKESIRRKETRP